MEKAGLITLVKMRFLPVDDNFSLRGETLQRAIEEDRERGLVPVFVSHTVCAERESLVGSWEVPRSRDTLGYGAQHCARGEKEDSGNIRRRIRGQEP